MPRLSHPPSYKTKATFGQQYKAQSSSHYAVGYLQSSVTSSLSGPNIHSAANSQTSSDCSSLNVKHQVSDPYRTRGSIIFYCSFRTLWCIKTLVPPTNVQFYNL